jgi:hypothetical protein
LGKPNPRAVEDGVRLLLEAIASPPLAIRSDDHRAYPRAIAALGVKVSHRITLSTQRRDRRNPLWEVNLLDLMIRHSTAAHKRETIAFSKRRQASIEKLAIFQLWRNYIKRRWEKGALVTSAMLLGVASRPWRIEDLLRKRLFFEKTTLTTCWQRYYRRETQTRALGINRTHHLSYAF